MRPKLQAPLMYRPENFAKFTGLKLHSGAQLVISDISTPGTEIICGHGGVGGRGRKGQYNL